MMLLPFFCSRRCSRVFAAFDAGNSLVRSGIGTRILSPAMESILLLETMDSDVHDHHRRFSGLSLGVSFRLLQVPEREVDHHTPRGCDEGT